jgi:uncharacterized membrane protein (DUF4010 family)
LLAAQALPPTLEGGGLGLAVAALVGLTVGIEREWSGHATGPGARFAGARTFFLLGGLGGLAGWLMLAGGMLLAAVLLAGAALLVSTAYAIAARREPVDPDGTTEVAALVVLALGIVAGLGFLRLASASAVVVVVALSEKGRIHGFVQRLDAWELRGALQFAVLALVVLPLLPAGPYGPLGGIRPQALWVLVLVFSGLNFLGFVARRVIGMRRGYGFAGLVGGLISSTAVTLAFARRSRAEPEASSGLAAGVLGACTVLLVRVAIVTFVLSPPTGLALVPYLVLPLGVGVLLTTRIFREKPTEAEQAEAPLATPESPLRLMSAIRLAVLFQGSLMALEWVQGRFGSPGVLPLAALLGLTDMDALTVTMARLQPAGEMAALGALAIGVGLLSNTLLKLGVAVGLGTGEFRRPAGIGLVLLAVATLLGLLVL